MLALFRNQHAMRYRGEELVYVTRRVLIIIRQPQRGFMRSNLYSGLSLARGPAVVMSLLHRWEQQN